MFKSVSPQSILKATEVCRKYPRLSTIYKVEEPCIRVKITTTNHTESNNISQWNAPTIKFAENSSTPFYSEDSSLYEEEYPMQYSRSREEVYEVPLWLVNSYGSDFQRRQFHTNLRQNSSVIDTAKKVGKGSMWVASKSGKFVSLATSLYTVYKTFAFGKSKMYRWAFRVVLSLLSYVFYAFYAKIWPFAKQKIVEAEEKAGIDTKSSSIVPTAAHQKAA